MSLATFLTNRRFFWGVLALSLIVNGFFVGMAVTGWFDPPRRGGPLRFEIDSVGRNLPEDYRVRMKEDVRTLLPEMRPRWKRLRELRQEIGQEAAKPAPDRTKIERNLEEIRAITGESQAVVQKRIFDTVLAFPPEARAGLGTERDTRP